jgi:pimeloyl-ACP methyl ester carboxylesterase
MELDHHRGGAGEPLVLVHGLGHTWRAFEPMLPSLEPSFDVVALDLPGFGHSAPLPAGIAPTAEALADAVERQMDAAGFDTAHVAGNSLGGWIALVLGRRGRARSVTAISPLGLQHGRERAWGRNLLLGLRWVARNVPAPAPLLRSPVGRTLFAGLLLGKPWRADPEPLIEQSELFAQAPGFLPTLSQTFETQVIGLNAIPCPVLVLWGTHDLILPPRQGLRFERLVPDCELRYLSGLGHAPMADDPGQLARAIREWAERATPSPAPPAPAPV